MADNDTNPPIVDCDVLEAAKENVQPLASGRRVTSLSAILSTPLVRRESKLAATRNRLRINVEIALDDEDGDPLEAYCNFVNWTLDNYPQGHSAESGLLELLEEATRVLKDHQDGKWRGELKYLKLWLLYASFVERPTIIYQFLIVNEIGTDFALLYEEYAAVLERDGRKKEADGTYNLGIARRASPLEHLQTKFAEFQKRMMTSVSPAPPSSGTPSSSVRLVLAPSASSSQSGSTSSRVTSSRSDPLVSQDTTRLATRSNNSLQIFVDASGDVSQPSDGANAWPDIGTRKTRVKENVPEVKKMGGTTLKQARRSKRMTSSSQSGAAGSKFMPYRDSEPAEMPPPPALISEDQDTISNKPAKVVPFVDMPEGSKSTPLPATPMFTPFRDETGTSTVPGASATDTVMKVKKANPKTPLIPSEAEALRKDPLKNYSESGLGLDTEI